MPQPILWLNRNSALYFYYPLVAVCVAYAALQPAILEHFARIAGTWRAAVAVALVAPPVVAMGMPFPLGLRSLGGSTSGLIPWAWAINGCAPVVSAVLAVVLAMHFGFTAVILSAATLYSIAAIIGRRGIGKAPVTSYSPQLRTR